MYFLYNFYIFLLKNTCVIKSHEASTHMAKRKRQFEGTQGCRNNACIWETTRDHWSSTHAAEIKDSVALGAEVGEQIECVWKLQMVSRKLHVLFTDHNIAEWKSPGPWRLCWSMTFREETTPTVLRGTGCMDFEKGLELPIKSFETHSSGGFVRLLTTCVTATRLHYALRLKSTANSQFSQMQGIHNSTHKLMTQHLLSPTDPEMYTGNPHTVQRLLFYGLLCAGSHRKWFEYDDNTDKISLYKGKIYTPISTIMQQLEHVNDVLQSLPQWDPMYKQATDLQEEILHELKTHNELNNKW